MIGRRIADPAPPTETIRVVATLRRFLRESTPWRGLRATADQASGSTLRRCLARWAETGLLAKVHALLVSMLRGHPDLILDSCSVRAKRGGDLTGPNPTDRGKQGTKCTTHVASGALDRLGPCVAAHFVAQYRLPHDCCVRFAVVVTFHAATLATGGRYPIPGSDFHRLDRASFAWRTQSRAYTNPH